MPSTYERIGKKMWCLCVGGMMTECFEMGSLVIVK